MAGSSLRPGAERAARPGSIQASSRRGRGPLGAALLAVLAALCALATPAQAAVLVSNSAESDTGRLVIGASGGWDKLAQGFRTGATGATLRSVELKLSAGSSGLARPVPTVEVRQESETGTLVATLSGTANISNGTARFFTFTAPASTTLSASTDYFVVLTKSSRGVVGRSAVIVRVTSSDGQSGESNWSIANGSRKELSSSGSWSDDSNALLIRVNAPTAPAAPGAFTATPGDTQVALSWTAPDTGGAAITKYQVRHASGSSVPDATTWTDVPDGSDMGDSAADETGYTVTSLTNGTQYAFEVRAVNSIGNGTAAAATATPTDTAATGKPTISGKARVGQTLTAAVGTIADADGLPTTFPDDYTLQWTREDADGTNKADISGATSGTYTPVAADVGKKIRVNASFTDDASNSEGPLESDVWPGTGTVKAAVTVSSIAVTSTPAATSDTYGLDEKIRFTVTFSEPVSVSASPNEPHFNFALGPTGSPVTTPAPYESGTGTTALVFAYTVQAGDSDPNGIWIRSSSENTLALETGEYIRAVSDAADAVIDFTDQGGQSDHKVDGSLALGVVVDPTTLTVVEEATGGTYTVKLGTQPSASVTVTPALSTADATKATLSPTTALTFTTTTWNTAQTVTVSGDQDTDANDETVTVTHAVTSTDTNYAALPAPSVTVTVTDDDSVNNAATGTPAISGKARVGQTLTAAIGTIADTDGLPTTFPGDYTLQWTREDADGMNKTDISGATSGTYTPVAADVGKKIRVKASFTDDASNDEGPLASDAWPATGTVKASVTVSTVAVTSTPAAMTDTYGVGETIRFTVTFTEAVAVSTGRPHFEFSLGPSGGGVDTEAAYARGTGTTALVFAYTVQASDSDDNGIWIGTESRTLKLETGEYIRAVADQVDAVLTHAAPGTQVSHKVDGSLTPPAPTNRPPPPPPVTAPPAPMSPTVTAVAGSPTSLRVTWTAPPGPAIRSYALQYRAGTSGPFINGPQDVTGTRTTLTGLTPGTRYQVHVRASTAAGSGPWSPAGSGTTPARNTPPVFTRPLTDQQAMEGHPFTYVIPADAVTDADGDPLTYAATTRPGGALPAWLTFDGATRTFTGTPRASDVGTVPVTVTASDGRAVASDAFDLTVLLVDPSALPGWLSRFGRTVGTHVTAAVGARLRGAGDAHVTVGGYQLPLGSRKPGAAEPDAGEPGAALLAGVAGLLGIALPPAGAAGSGPDGDAGSSDRAPRVGPGQTPTLNLDLRRILLGSAFQLPLSATDTPGAPRLTAWGRVAGTQFTGREGAVAAEGDVLTGTVGVDGAWARWLAGLAVAHSRGDGTSRQRDSGARAELGHSLTSLHPYLRYAVNDRLDVWGLLGYGWGEVTVAPEPGQRLDTETQLAMGAFGGRGQLVTATANGGLAIATRTEAMFTHLTSEAGAGLAAADAAAHRLRVVLEGSRRFTWEAGQSLTPAIEVGVRRDWGDAETGFGLELGGRMQYADPAGGFLLEGALRGLVAHEDEHYGEWGASGALRIEPGPAGQGLSLTLAPTWGAVASGVQGLWTRQTTAGLAPQSPAPSPGGQVALHLGYGLWVPPLESLLTPFTTGSLTDAGNARTRAGVVFDRRDPWGGTLRLELAGEWLATPGRPPDQTIGFQVHLSFGHGSRGLPTEGVRPPSPGRDPGDRAREAPPGAPDRGRLPTPFRVR